MNHSEPPIDDLHGMSEEEVAQKLETAAMEQHEEWERITGALGKVGKGEKDSVVVAKLILEAREALAKGERQLALIISSGEGCAHVVFDGMGLVTGFSPGCEKILGQHAPRLIGQPIDSILSRGLYDVEESAEEMSRAGRGESVVTVRAHQRSDGSLFDAEHTVVAIVGALGDVTGYLREIKDLTNRRIHQVRIDELNAALALLVPE